MLYDLDNYPIPLVDAFTRADGNINADVPSDDAKGVWVSPENAFAFRLDVASNKLVTTTATDATAGSGYISSPAVQPLSKQLRASFTIAALGTVSGNSIGFRFMFGAIGSTTVNHFYRAFWSRITAGANDDTISATWNLNAVGAGVGNLTVTSGSTTGFDLGVGDELAIEALMYGNRNTIECARKPSGGAWATQVLFTDSNAARPCGFSPIAIEAFGANWQIDNLKYEYIVPEKRFDFKAVPL